MDPGAVPERGAIFLRSLGIRLFLSQERIYQIIVYNAQLRTDRYVHVFSHVRDVYSAYGRPIYTEPISGGYYLRYDRLGIGFDVDGRTNLVRAIVIFRRGP